MLPKSLLCCFYSLVPDGGMGSSDEVILQALWEDNEELFFPQQRLELPVVEESVFVKV